MTAWTAQALDRIGAADELEIAVLRPDGTPRTPVPVWVVRDGDGLYIRSWRGDGGGWFRAARTSRAGHITAGDIEADVVFLDADENLNDAIDGAYRAKYARYPSYIAPMISPQARATTLRLVPADRESRS